MKKNMPLSLPRPTVEEEEPRDQRLTICLTKRHFDLLDRLAIGHGKPRATFAAWLVEKYAEALDDNRLDK